MGTYVLNVGIRAMHKTAGQLTDRGAYTFHVGPISELEVRDGGAASPLAPAGRTAYTVVAANNGPDTAPDVVVSLAGVPRGAEAIISEGDYAEGACDAAGLCAATWTLGAVRSADATLGPSDATLTLIPVAGAEAPATVSASIRNTRPYTVAIDGTTHSTDYFDYIDENNTARIAARPGTGAGAPGQPRRLSARVYPDLRSVLLRWDEVERLHQYAVTHYEVHRSAPAPGCRRPPVSPPAGEIVEVRGELYLDEALRSGQERCYAVRAVNGLDDKGYWSHSAGTLRGMVLSKSAVTVAEAAGHADYTVVLSSQPSDDVTVRLDASNRDAPGSPGAVLLSPHVLRFTPQNWNTPRTVRVIGADDDVDNPSNRRTAIITHTASGGGYASAPAATLRVTVTDDDGPQRVTLSAERVTVAEDGGEGRYTLALTGEPSGPVQIDLSVTTADGTPAATVAPTRLTFLPEDWSEPRPVTVTGQNDDADNAGDQRTVTISHAISGGGYDGVDVPDVTVTVVDDDGPPPLANDPGVTVSETSIIVPENGAGSYNVVLNSAPTGDVRIDLSSENAALATVAPDHLTFTPGDWDAPQLVVVSGVDDTVDNPGGRRSTQIHHAVSGGGYDTVAADPVDVAVTDDETAGITVSVAAVDLAETGDAGAGEAHDYTVRLATEPTGEVTVTVASADTGVATVQPQRLRFTPDDWFIPHVVTVTGANDGEANPGGERRTEITHTVEGGGYEAAPQTVAVTVSDDDRAGVVVSETGLYLSGRGGRATYTVKLASRPTHDVTLLIVPGGTENPRLGIAHGGRQTQGRLAHDLVFTPGNWNRTRTVEVTNLRDVRGTLALHHRTTSEDANYQAMSWADVTLERVGKPSIVLAAVSSPIKAGEDAEFTVSVEGGALPYDLDVRLRVDGGPILTGGARNFTVVIPAGQTMVAVPSFRTSIGDLQPPDYRCIVDAGGVSLWVLPGSSYTSDYVLTPARVRVEHPQPLPPSCSP
ncbi:MAG: hypothetical protein F4Z64_09590 [Acidimicrobiaceae bacterium]|nr:hypothetical protein [Acidimicrobiaceae bacterium]MYE97669.1 hypothetical protein [Acidimicrobiaceae bacterium]